MLRGLAVLVGLLLLAVGIFSLLPDSHSFGKFGWLLPLNDTESYLYIGTGTLSLLAGLTSKKASKIILILIGLAYAGLAALSLKQGTGKLFTLLDIRSISTYFYAALAVLCLYAGIFIKAD